MINFTLRIMFSGLGFTHSLAQWADVCVLKLVNFSNVKCGFSGNHLPGGRIFSFSVADCISLVVVVVVKQ